MEKDMDQMKEAIFASLKVSVFPVLGTGVIYSIPIKDWVSIAVGIVTAICTILVTRHTLKKK
jgi:hypothetical protein